MMTATTLIDVRLLTGGYEVTSDSNQVELTRSRDAVQATVFGQKSHTYKPGLKTVTYTLNGYFQSDGATKINDINESQFVGTSANVVTFVAPDGAVGANTHSFQGVDMVLTPFGGQIGAMAAFTVSGQGTGDSFTGTLVEAGTTARSSSSQSTAYLLGDVASGETVYAALHVIATTLSPTLDVTIQSDTSGFPSPSTKLTFPQATAVGDGFQTSTTTTTDTYWRAAWTFGGTGTITFLVTIGIA